VLNELHRRLEAAEDVTGIERSGDTLEVRSRAVPTWAYVVSVALPPLPFKSRLLRARTERLLRITAVGDAPQPTLHFDGDANESVSKVLVTTSHELFPQQVAAWDDD